MTWDILFPIAVSYLLLCLARDTWALASYAFRLRKETPTASLKSLQPSPTKAPTLEKIEKIYFIQGPNNKAHFSKSCGGRDSEMVTMDVCKHCQKKAGKTA
eukprot:Skav233264  [mRNA]  locus=scaffold4476:22789:23201:- [translate_table: standard]